MTITSDMFVVAGVGLACIALVLLVILAVRVGKSAHQSARLGELMRQMGEGQSELRGNLAAVSQAQVDSQARLIELMEGRLASVAEMVTNNLQTSATATANSLGELQQRLKTIDKAQENITRLSGDVLSLQDILSNKQTRGAFGEIQLHDILSKALPKDSYSLQVSLSNGRRADCLIHLPNPPGPIVIDAKFPLEAYEALRRAETRPEARQAARDFQNSVRAHIRAIADRYILEGETGDGALMFLPSEAVYAELHANFGEVVREGFDARVWIVSPTTCMATLNTMRSILKDVRMREAAGAIREELSKLDKDMDRLLSRVGNLDRHFAQAQKDVEEIKISASKAGGRARRLDHFDFDGLDTAPEPVEAPARSSPRVIRASEP